MHDGKQQTLSSGILYRGSCIVYLFSEREVSILDTASSIMLGAAVLYLVVKLIGYLSRLGIKQLAARDMDGKKGVMLIDVRTDKEYNAGHIPGAVHIPLADVGAKAKKIKKDKEIVVYCQSGNRSIWAIKRLMAMGYTNLWNLKGGYNAWKRLHR
jgi:rhodanese-related sulfurtransferase